MLLEFKSIIIQSCPFSSFAATSVRDEVSARAGEDVQLPCSVNREECGDYHSIKWYILATSGVRFNVCNV